METFQKRAKAVKAKAPVRKNTQTKSKTTGVKTTELWRAKEGRHSGDVSWTLTRELDPECAYFPPGAWGPAMKQSRKEQFLCTVRLAYDQAVTVDGSGVYTTVFSNSPAGAQNWSNYANVFDQYRVLGYRVTFEPYWTVNITFTPFASVIDRSDSTALTSYGLAERYGSHKKVMGKAKWTQMANMSSVDTADFIPTTSVTADTWIKTYTSGNTASQTIGRMNVELLVQFRGVGIN